VGHYEFGGYPENGHDYRSEYDLGEEVHRGAVRVSRLFILGILVVALPGQNN
jgi:hypothetical protein